MDSFNIGDEIIWDNRGRKYTGTVTATDAVDGGVEIEVWQTGRDGVTKRVRLWATASSVSKEDGQMWTIFAQWPNGDQEEFDVRAKDGFAAQQKAIRELNADYNPGWKIVGRVARPEGYMF